METEEDSSNEDAPQVIVQSEVSKQSDINESNWYLFSSPICIICKIFCKFLYVLDLETIRYGLESFKVNQNWFLRCTLKV